MDERAVDKGDTVDTMDSAPGASREATLTARAAAEALGVSHRTVRRAIDRGDLAATKYAGTYRIAPEALQSFRRRLTSPARLRRSAPETPTPVTGNVPHLLPSS